jgi:SAM-dependent methyltransferase
MSTAVTNLPTHPETEGFTRREDGVFLPTRPIEHREDEYDSGGFDILRDMQSRHFWYRGRHRFLLGAVGRTLHLSQKDRSQLHAIDLGAGCGGWAAYLQARRPQWFAELAVADSSVRALEYAASVVGPETSRYQIDLLNLPWRERWDAAFLLDVLEHIPDDAGTLKQIFQCLRPGGYLFVTTPALRFFWSYNDDMAHHLRRYSRGDFARLAAASGFEPAWSRYFMFFLSPLLLLGRAKSVDVKRLTREEIQAHLARTHRVPVAPVNSALGLAFSCETPLGLWLPFPWGTSVLGVFRKPSA